jgi:hypothetical protein
VTPLRLTRSRGGGEAGFDLNWLRGACEHIAAIENESDGGGRGYAFEACQLWCSHGDGVTTPLHYDMSDNFLAQIEGTKELRS